MDKISQPIIKVLASGNNLIAKQMQANSGEILPEHLASLESILLVQEGECILNLSGEDHVLKQGHAFVVPPKIRHQIKVNKDFKAIHFMPKDIKFEFFNL